MIEIYEKNRQKIEKNDFIKFLEKLDIQVKTNTKARGHQGVYFKNRIDISKYLDDNRSTEVLAHEFAHYVHSKIESDIFKTGGSLSKLFCLNDCSIIEKELIMVTDFCDKNSRLISLKKLKNQAVQEIKMQEEIIKKDYPKFLRSKKFKEFDRYIRKSNARYLLKFDRVKIISGFFRQEKRLSIDNLENDFIDMPRAFAAYIRLRSLQRRQSRIARRINKLNKYYKRPSELFARFVEAFFKSQDMVRVLAPSTSSIFFELLEEGYYFELKDLFKIAEII